MKLATYQIVGSRSVLCGRPEPLLPGCHYELNDALGAELLARGLAELVPDLVVEMTPPGEDSMLETKSPDVVVPKKTPKPKGTRQK